MSGVGGGVAAANVVASYSASSAQVELKNFGLVLNCHPNCVHARANDGALYLRFDGYPSVGAPTRDGLAAHAGLRDGDVVISVNGLSPMTEEGALLLNRSDKELTLSLEISRAGKRQKIVLKL
jgi:C-terminal processing protease CtpA/Prc